MAVYSRYLRWQARRGYVRPLPPYALYGGSCWWSLTREAVSYICAHYNWQGWYDRLEDTFVPDELYVQTLLLNSGLRDTLVNDNLRYILWENRNGACPAVLDETDADAVLASAQLIGGKLYLNYNKDVADHPCIYTLDGKKVQDVQLPSLGSVGFSGSKDDDECFFSFSSFTVPADSNTYEKFYAPKTVFDPEAYVTEQVFYPSKDSTLIPMFLTYRKGLERDGSNPVLLYGYGGFGITLPPSFSASRIPFLEQGGIYAQANLRGGSEYGDEWHVAGTKMQKQNVFDDFIAAAQYLIDHRYTCSGKLAIQGGSNGGLLVGACMTQRPDLFQVAVPQVGVMDMLRYHKFTIGWNWASDYGTSADSNTDVRVPERLLAPAQPEARHALSGHARDHRRPRRPCGSGPLLQVCRHLAGLQRRGQSHADTHRQQGRARRRQAGGQADRRTDGHIQLHHVQPGHDVAQVKSGSDLGLVRARPRPSAQ